MTLSMIKRLDEKSLKHLKEADGPCDVCICGILKEPEETGLAANVKRYVRCIGEVLGVGKKPKPAKGGKGKKAGDKKGKKKPPPPKKGAKGRAPAGKGGKSASASSSSSSNKSGQSSKGKKKKK